MKKIVIIMLLGSIACYYSCKKTELALPYQHATGSSNDEVEDLIDTLVGDTTTIRETLPIKIRIGTHLFDNCNGSNPCGPCPGICIRWERLGTTVYASPFTPYTGAGADIDLPPGEIYGSITYDGEKIHLQFNDEGIDIGNETTIIPADFSVGPPVAAYFGKTDIIIKEGTYSIDYSNPAYARITFDDIVVQ